MSATNQTRAFGHGINHLHSSRSVVTVWRMFSRRRPSNNWFQAGLSALLMAMVLLLDVLAASPELHERIHQDRASSSHECAVTLFAHGQVDSACVEVSLIQPLAWVERVVPVEIFSFSPAIEHLPAGRAPPVFILPS